MPHGNSRSRQTVHLEHITTSQLAEVAVICSTGSLSRRLIASQNTVQLFTRFINTVTSLEEERYVPDMVQTERNQGSLDNTVDTESQFRVLISSPIGEGLDCVTDWWPNECHHGTSKDCSKTGNNRNKTLTGKEAQIIRQLYPVEAVKHVSSNTTCNDAAQNTGFR